MNYPEFVKYNRIPHLAEVPRILDRNILVFEKLDGGNTQVRNYRGRILAGNRANFLTDSFVRSKAHIPECRWFGDFLKWATGNYSFYHLPEDKIVFGEWLARHTLDYSPENVNRFYLIDVFDLNSKRFVPYTDAVRFLKEKGIRDVQYLRPLFKGVVGNIRKLEGLVSKSDYRDGSTEGVVIKDYNSQEFAKLWQNSINRKKRDVAVEDVRRTLLTMVESGIEITEDSVIDEMCQDIQRQGIRYSLSSIRNAVTTYFSDPRNLY